MLEADGLVRTGRAVDARTLPVDGAAVVAAVRGEGDTTVTVEAPTPRAVHERVGFVRPGMGLSVRTALAAAARSTGLAAPQDDDIAAAREELAAIEVPETEPTAARRDLAAADTETERLEERVAELRGTVQTLRDRDADASAAESKLASAVRDLSEVATERTAADQRLDRDRLRDARDARERRLRLEDEKANLERAARSHLVGEVRDAYAAAVADAPGPTPEDPLAADPVTAALAAGRVAELRAPVVLACDRFPAPAAAASWLGAPVVRV